MYLFFIFSQVQELLSSIIRSAKFLDEILWQDVNFILILAFGFYFTIKSKFFQIRTIFNFKKCWRALNNVSKTEKRRGVNPIKLYFTSIGGSIGLGNVVAVSLVVTIGGPGGIFWMWLASILGMLVKYAEVYLGILSREKNDSGGYDGGPMIYIKEAFGVKFLPVLFSFLICIYGVEIYQFKVIQDVIIENVAINRYLILLILLVVTIYVTFGGIKRLSKIMFVLMPIFLIGYTLISCYVLGINYSKLPGIFRLIFTSAFSGHAAVGGFAGSTMIMAAHHGMSQAVYSGDIGIGYDSVIQSETQLKKPGVQAQTAIFSLLTDSFICTMTVLLILVTGKWCIPGISSHNYIIAALSDYIPFIKEIMAVFFFLVGWTTIIGYLAVGFKNAKSINKNGHKFYIIYAVIAFIIFSFIPSEEVRVFMSLSGGLLLLINLFTIFKLRKKIFFEVKN